MVGKGTRTTAAFVLTYNDYIQTDRYRVFWLEEQSPSFATPSAAIFPLINTLTIWRRCFDNVPPFSHSNYHHIYCIKRYPPHCVV